MKKSLKKTCTLLTSVLLSAALGATSVFGAEANITTEQKFAFLKNQGILEGRANGDLALEETMTRAELAAVLVRLLHLDLVAKASSSFADAKGHWADPYIYAVKQAGIMEGKSDTEFDPDGKVTIEEMAAVYERTLKLEDSGGMTITGAYSSWAKQAVSSAVHSGILPVLDNYTVPSKRELLVAATYYAYEKLNPEQAPDEASGHESALDGQQVIKLVGDAQQHYWHVQIGGNLEGLITGFEVPGKNGEYRWMGDDLATKEKLFAYLGEIYTPDQVEAYWNQQIESGSLVQMDGKLAQPNADGGSMREWSKAEVNSLQVNDLQAVVKLTVPVGEEEKEEAEVQLKFMEGTGWRLDQPVGAIR